MAETASLPIIGAATGRGFNDFAARDLGWGSYCHAARRTPRLAALYDTVATPLMVREAERRFLAAGGSPDDVSRKAAAAFGYRQVWVLAPSTLVEAA